MGQIDRLLEIVAGMEPTVFVVVVGVHVDKAGDDGFAGGIDNDSGSVGDTLADANDAAALDDDGSSVDHLSVLEGDNACSDKRQPSRRDIAL